MICTGGKLRIIKIYGQQVLYNFVIFDMKENKYYRILYTDEVVNFKVRLYYFI